MSSLKEQVFDEVFRDVKHWYECKDVLLFGFSLTGKPGHWIAKPFCGKRLVHWMGFSEIQYSKTVKICPSCLLVYAVNQVANLKKKGSVQK